MLAGPDRDNALNGLLSGTVSFGLYGLYLATFLLSVVASRFRPAVESIVSTQILWISWITAGIVTCRQVTLTAFIRDTICRITVEDDPNSPMCKMSGSDPFNTYSIPVRINIYTPPLVALLSDGILAWRVYSVWNRRSWMRYLLATAVTLNFVVGLAVAIWGSLTDDFTSQTEDKIADLYQAWAWAAFVTNSAMSMSILFRIGYIGRIYERELGRYSTVVRAIIESALLSWIATLGSAMAWSQNARCIVRVNYHRDVENCFFAGLNGETLNSARTLSTAMVVCLPVLLAISQVLIITRVNISKTLKMCNLAEAVTDVTGGHGRHTIGNIASQELQPRGVLGRIAL